MSGYKNRKAILAAGISAFAVAMVSRAAAAQNVTAEDVALEGVGYEEIVVTAQKRSQNVEDVPIAISAFDTAFVKRTNLDDVKDLVKFTPGFAGDSKDSFVDYINVRGISTNDFGVGGDPSVAFFKNGFYQGRNGAVVSSMFDMDRAEVLRGPQGFLFGRSAIAGAISIYTAAPETGVTKGRVELGIGERGILEGEGMINMPVGENMAIRLAGYGSKEDGYVTNINQPDQDKLIAHEKYAFRASGLYEGDGWDATVVAEYEDRKQSGSVYYPILADGTTAFLQELLPQDNLLPGADLRTVNVDEGLGNADNGEILSITATVNVDLGFATLTSQTGYKDHEYYYAEDFDALPVAVNSYRQDQEGDYFEQELRLIGNNEGPLSWYGGVSYYKENINTLFEQQSNEDVQCAYYYYYYYGTRNCAELWSYWEYPEFSPSSNGLLEANRIIGDNSGWGAYVDMTYGISDTLEMGLGLRYSKDRKSFALNALPVDSELGPWWALGFVTDGFISTEESWDDFTPRFVMRYTPRDNHMFYASVSRGYKSGGFGSFVANVVDADEDGIADATSTPDDFGAEQVWSYEVGAKSSFLDRRLLVDLSVYHYRYRDMQLTFGSPTKVGNIGNVKATGIETTVQAILGQYFDFYLAASYNDNSVSNAEIIEENSAGNRLTGAPKYIVSGLLNFNKPVSSTAEINAALDFRYQSKTFASLANLARNQVNSWRDVSVRLGYRDDSGWAMTAYVENLFNAKYFDGSNSGEGILPGTYFGISRPTTMGLRFSYDFGG